MLLEINDLRVHYGKAEALKGISLKLNEGEIVTLLGANGAGKTTTLRTISGIKWPTSGEVWFQGKRIDRMPIHEIVRMGIAHIPEGRRVFAALTVGENLEMGAYARRHKQEIAQSLERIYEIFPVLKVKHRQLAGTLSGGEQQMLATARGLMAKPILLLMDEPSLGLSPLFVREVGRVIKDINQTGVSILLVEQNARMGISLANRVYVLETGTVALQGDAKELANDSRVRKAYLGS